MCPAACLARQKPGRRMTPAVTTSVLLAAHGAECFACIVVFHPAVLCGWGCYCDYFATGGNSAFKGGVVSPNSTVLIRMLLSPNFVSPTLTSPLNSRLTCYCIFDITS